MPRSAALIVFFTDIHSLGQEAAQDMLLTSVFCREPG
jgi:hypothetical protein